MSLWFDVPDLPSVKDAQQEVDKWLTAHPEETFSFEEWGDAQQTEYITFTEHDLSNLMHAQMEVSAFVEKRQRMGYPTFEDTGDLVVLSSMRVLMWLVEFAPRFAQHLKESCLLYLPHLILRAMLLISHSPHKLAALSMGDASLFSMDAISFDRPSADRKTDSAYIRLVSLAITDAQSIVASPLFQFKAPQHIACLKEAIDRAKQFGREFLSMTYAGLGNKEERSRADWYSANTTERGRLISVVLSFLKESNRTMEEAVQTFTLVNLGCLTEDEQERTESENLMEQILVVFAMLNLDKGGRPPVARDFGEVMKDVCENITDEMVNKTLLIAEAESQIGDRIFKGAIDDIGRTIGVPDLFAKLKPNLIDLFDFSNPTQQEELYRLPNPQRIQQVFDALKSGRFNSVLVLGSQTSKAMKRFVIPNLELFKPELPLHVSNYELSSCGQNISVIQTMHPSAAHEGPSKGAPRLSLCGFGFACALHLADSKVAFDQFWNQIQTPLLHAFRARAKVARSAGIALCINLGTLVSTLNPVLLDGLDKRPRFTAHLRNLKGPNGHRTTQIVEICFRCRDKDLHSLGKVQCRVSTIYLKGPPEEWDRKALVLIGWNSKYRAMVFRRSDHIDDEQYDYRISLRKMLLSNAYDPLLQMLMNEDYIEKDLDAVAPWLPTLDCILEMPGKVHKPHEKRITTRNRTVDGKIKTSEVTWCRAKTVRFPLPIPKAIQSTPKACVMDSPFQSICYEYHFRYNLIVYYEKAGKQLTFRRVGIIFEGPMIGTPFGDGICDGTLNTWAKDLHRKGLLDSKEEVEERLAEMEKQATIKIPLKLRKHQILNKK